MGINLFPLQFRYPEDMEFQFADWHIAHILILIVSVRYWSLMWLPQKIGIQMYIWKCKLCNVNGVPQGQHTPHPSSFPWENTKSCGRKAKQNNKQQQAKKKRDLYFKLGPVLFQFSRLATFKISCKTEILTCISFSPDHFLSLSDWTFGSSPAHLFIHPPYPQPPPLLGLTWQIYLLAKYFWAVTIMP